MSLVPCPGCSRHVKNDETCCPFCRHVPRAASFGALVALASALTGCPDSKPAPPPDQMIARYGAPPREVRAPEPAPPSSATDAGGK